jgi:hypothetical protein
LKKIAEGDRGISPARDGISHLRGKLMILYEQIKKTRYTADSPREGYEKVCTQDISFYGKTCRVYAGR